MSRKFPCFSIIFLNIFSIFLSSFAFSSEKHDKDQINYNLLVHNCICDFLESEADNNSYLDYSRIVYGCNGLVEDNFFQKNFKPIPLNPQLNQLECKSSVSKWIKSKK